MANTKGNRDSGCFATVLRHLLCRQGAPTHPTDVAGDLGLSPVGPCERIPEERSQLGGRTDELGVTSSGRRAGLVARLMGLETLPDMKWVPSVKSPDVFSRSRSVNFMDYLLEVDLSSVRAPRHRHRRAKTSVSYHEVSVPTSVPLAKEKDFIIVILEDREREEDGQENEMVVRPRKREVRRGKKSDWSSKEKKVLKLRDEPRTRNRAACNHKSGQSKVSARKSNRKDAWKPVVIAASDGDGSSPVSVLDKPEGRYPQGNNLAVFAPANSSRKAERRHGSTSTQVARTSDPITSPERKVATKEAEVPQEMKLLDDGKHLDDVILQVQRLAEEEAMNPSWLSCDSPIREEICRTIEQHSLDCLLEELVMFSPGKSSDTTASGARRRDRAQEV
ncbi:hypothetical protein MLD38_023916 [Melastoma candidum]|uniref:Uncharacterized protein n=1 Tax=Melastoma candidum TaxID=119954 RepID=A0ACB9NQR4_9MYRT|nr:hypothetical protein MLD38_023916 [Melastoma candidum]